MMVRRTVDPRDPRPVVDAALPDVDAEQLQTCAEDVAEVIRERDRAQSQVNRVQEIVEGLRENPPKFLDQGKAFGHALVKIAEVVLDE